MPPTLRSLVDAQGLGVTVAAGSHLLGRRVRWVHVSELEDPTPYLEGGELLLTTGLRLGEDAEAQRAYVARLAEAGVVGLGFGVGFTYDQVPEPLVAAAEERSLAVLLIPKATPFVALSKLVASALAREERAELGSTLDKQRELTTAALSPAGPRAVVELLANSLGGWVVLLDQNGRPRHAAPAAARRHGDRLAAELETLRKAGGTSSFSLQIGRDSVLLHPLTVHGAPRGFLMVGTQQPPTTLQRSLEHVAVSLLSIDLAKSWAARSAERSLRAALLRLAVEGRYDLAVTVTDQAAIPMPAPPMRMAVLSAPHEQLPELMELLESDPALQAASTLVAMIDSKRLGLITSADGGTQCLEAVLVQVPGARGGISEPASIDELGTAWDQAMNAFDACVDLGLPLAQPRDVTASRLVGHLDLPSVRAWAHELLEPLVQRDLLAGAELVDSLQVFLKHTGQVDRAAAALGVHRHTVRHRIQKIEQILGRSLDDATTRSELWIALQLTGRQDVG